jgi:hypothetical protein
MQMFGLVIIGGGPAGLAPLLAAHRSGQLNALLAKGVAVVEQSTRIGDGSIGGYAINSDSSGRTFVDCLDGDGSDELTSLLDHPLTQQLAAAGDGAVALRDAGKFLRLVGDALHRMLLNHPACAVLTGHRAILARQRVNGWAVRVRNLADQEERTLLSRNIVIAAGAHQPRDRLAQETVGGVKLIERWADRLLQSGDVVATGGLERVAQLLAGKTHPRVAIIGGSTSAAAVAHALLHRLPDIRFGTGGITLLHRRELRIYYPDIVSAQADGYTEWTENDICPISGRVFRLAGFRLDSRELIMQARGIGGRAPEPRLRLHRLQPDDDAKARRLIDEADIVIAALGYRPRGLPLHDRGGNQITLLSHTGPQMPMVDGKCRVVNAQGLPLPGLFAIGLAAGFVPHGPLGGEPSFRGQANGLWLWQHDVGLLIADAVAAACPDEASVSPTAAVINFPQHQQSVASIATSVEGD